MIPMTCPSERFYQSQLKSARSVPYGIFKPIATFFFLFLFCCVCVCVCLHIPLEWIPRGNITLFFNLCFYSRPCIFIFVSGSWPKLVSVLICTWLMNYSQLVIATSGDLALWPELLVISISLMMVYTLVR